MLQLVQQISPIAVLHQNFSLIAWKISRTFALFAAFLAMDISNYFFETEAMSGEIKFKRTNQGKKARK